VNDLKRIEEQHRGCGGSVRPDPCDVVKLARALECVLDSEGECECEEPGADGTCPWCRGWRTLEEVAG
jgi:hypothetical protein